ncbi:GNAT family N-acetyltransferase [Pararhizobium sp.]|uniref:GNAT family N-acetyltransferase n=1 Tax=Pararhizobium sp. TaxID=1977563 RepID=UPI0027167815|nr:N-acetyltransferase [Pararhizobium sp.]MDO9415437.1 N-acetyltransferase [Pararhizobium sp.]
MIIRPERDSDIPVIREVTVAAFAEHPHSDQTEHLIVEHLRKAGALTVSLVADDEGEIIGHVAFSPVILSSGVPGWFGLGPVSVRPDWQGEGVGAALIQTGLDHLRNLGANGCVVLGDEGFYSKFGFDQNAAIVLPDVAPQYFLSMALSQVPASGMVTYHPAFYAGQD